VKYFVGFRKQKLEVIFVIKVGKASPETATMSDITLLNATLNIKYLTSTTFKSIPTKLIAIFKMKI
jgi:hypothetical protein